MITKKITLSNDSVIFWLYNIYKNLIHHINYTIFQKHIKTLIFQFKTKKSLYKSNY